MPANKKRALRIPAGAPGHPKTGVDKHQARARDTERRTRLGPEAKPARDAERKPIAAIKRTAVKVPRGEARLVYEDESILAFDKPVGLPVISSEGSRARTLLDIASEHIKRANPKGRAAVVHRIDRDTSGIVIFAIHGRTKKLLMEGWDEIVKARVYVGLVEGTMPGSEGVFDSWLKENTAGGVYRAEPKERGAKRAVTRWKLLGAGSGLSLVELSLETGRKHQIRVQLADSGHPIVGDPRYGLRGEGPPVDLGRLCLHARLITIKLPGRDELTIESPPPPEFAATLAARRGPAKTAGAAAHRGPALKAGAAVKAGAPDRAAPSPRKGKPRPPR